MEESEAKETEAPGNDPESLAEKFAEYRYYTDEAFRETDICVKEKGSSETKTYIVRVELEPIFRASEKKDESTKQP